MKITSALRKLWEVVRLDLSWTLGGLTLRRLSARVVNRILEDDVPGRAAQLSYYFLLALFPLLIFLFALLGFAFSAGDALEHRVLRYLRVAMPPAAFELVRGTITDLAKSWGGGKLSVGLLTAFWFASSGTEALIEGLNRAFRVREAGPWWRRRLLALALTAGLTIVFAVSLGLLFFGGALGNRFAGQLGLRFMFRPLWRAARWAVLLALPFAGISLIYHYAPNLKGQRPHIILPGAVVALAGWHAASGILRWYLGSFGSLSKTYGSVGAVIALLLWLYITGAVLLVGGIINSEIRLALPGGGGEPEERPA